MRNASLLNLIQLISGWINSWPPHRVNMKTMPCAVLILVAMTTLGGTPAYSEVSAQSVRVEVSLEKITPEGVPRVFGYGGNIWWIPDVFGLGVAEKILNMKHLGMTRISLGDQLLNDASSIEDLKERLENYPLNDFLRRYVAEGGKVLFIFDGVPRWISSNKSMQKDGRGHRIFRNSPPGDYKQWSSMVEAIVRHFNGKLALNAYYEAWNEPIYTYRGSTQEFMKQYYYTVLGARKADGRALVGGPSVLEGVATEGTKQDTDAEKRHHFKQNLEQQFFYKQFLDYASKTAIPELGLRRLPVDFLSWHTFYQDPTNYYELVVPVVRDSLAAAGYPRNTPLFNSEWNIAAVPPYPEGNHNASHVGAAYAAMTLLAMRESGMDGQMFQMYVDPGVDGYSGGTFTRTGIPRANFNAFRLFSMVKGNKIQTNTTDPWVKSVAYSDGQRVYLLVATFVPTPKMIVETLKVQSEIENEQLAKSISKAGLAGTLMKGESLPEPFAGKVGKASKIANERAQSAIQKAGRWKDGLTLEIELSGSRRPKGNATRYVVDSTHSNIYPDLDKAERFLAERQEHRSANDSEKVAARLQEAGVSKRNVERFLSALKSKKPFNEALALISPDRREAVTNVVRQAVLDSLDHYKEDLNEIENWRSARLHEEPITWPSSGALRVGVEPYSVQLFVLTP